MHHLSRKVLLLFVFLLLSYMGVVILLTPHMSRAAAPSTYWVSKSGSDSNDCNASDTPLTTTAKLTIRAGFGCLTGGGQTLRVRAGIYTERFSYNAIVNGTSWDNAITVEANPGEQVIWSVPSSGPHALITDINWFILRGFVFDGTTGGNNLMADGYTSQPVTGAMRFLELGGVHMRIENNEFRNTAYAAMIINNEATDTHILNNYFHHIGKVYNCGTLYLKAPNSVVAGNLFQHQLCAPVMFWNQDFPSFVHNSVAHSNTIEDSGFFWAPTSENGTSAETGQRAPQGSMNTSAAGGISVTRGQNARVYNNLIKNTPGGLYAGYGAVDCAFYNNTIYGNPSTLADPSMSGIIFGNQSGINGPGFGTSGCVARNNIVYQPGVTNPAPIADLQGGGTNTFSHRWCG